MSKPNRPSSSSAWNTILLKPYGNELLTSSGKAVLAIMCAVMLMVSLVEGAAWGYALSGGDWFVGIPIGILVFLFMFVLDISLATSDLLEEKHKTAFSALSSRPALEKANINRFEKIVNFLFKGICGFVIRLLIAIVSLYITSGFITQFIFRAEIAYNLELKQNALVENKIKSLQAEKANAIQEIDIEYQEALKKRDEESKTGVGKRTEMLKSDSDKLKKDKEEKADLFDQRIASLSEAHKNKDYSGLRQENIIVVSDSQTEKGKIISSISDLAAFKEIDRAVHTLIFILAFGLIFIKLSQPDHLRLYYSSRLQELWRVYKEGSFDKL